ncbi:hypothetical protein PAT3040_00012 [Paenibacillus agaridevorans]|uniref:Uncharacterized protein n=1 Tax=Paenibacillus agaridevorans TaxID=171404 RepID=A0A2R5EG45_9BACL|nr:hypothetical protein [Paenibacillus agaridevorans]GBG05532.1 hypothetical protein PAT3040_00012 [Paenibacillus agaridevorans]
MKKIIALILMIGSCLTLASLPSVQALSCAEPEPAAEELARSSVAFMGQAIAANKEGLTIFQVQTAWKGVAESRIEIYDNGWDPYEPGQTYLVFGGEREGKLRTHLCGRSGLWNASRELAMKDIAIQPIPISSEASRIDPSSSPPSNSNALIPALVAVAGLLAVSIVAIWLIRLRRRKHQ